MNQLPTNGRPKVLLLNDQVHDGVGSAVSGLDRSLAGRSILDWLDDPSAPTVSAHRAHD